MKHLLSGFTGLRSLKQPVLFLFPMLRQHQQINPSKFLLTYINENRDAVADSDHLNQLIGKILLFEC